MPELPEVEVLVRNLAPKLRGRRIANVEIRRPRLLRPDSVAETRQALIGATIRKLVRRGKFLIFTVTRHDLRVPFTVLGHLGMTGRMFVQSGKVALAKHWVIALSFEDGGRFVFEDVRGFGRWTLDVSPLSRLGPEPIGNAVGEKAFARALRRSKQAIKIKLLDQSVIAGVGNIYASEALFDARISPRHPAHRLTGDEAKRLWRSVGKVLSRAIRLGSSLELDWEGAGRDSGLFYYGRSPDAVTVSRERFKVYEREGEPCERCGAMIRRIVQSARSTYYCPRCQRRRRLRWVGKTPVDGRRGDL